MIPTAFGPIVDMQRCKLTYRKTIFYKIKFLAHSIYLLSKNSHYTHNNTYLMHLITLITQTKVCIASLVIVVINYCTVIKRWGWIQNNIEHILWKQGEEKNEEHHIFCSRLVSEVKSVSEICKKLLFKIKQGSHVK